MEWKCKACNSTNWEEDHTIKKCTCRKCGSDSILRITVTSELERVNTKIKKCFNCKYFRYEDLGWDSSYGICKLEEDNKDLKYENTICNKRKL